MKRFFALVALVLGLASCQTEPEGLDVQMGGAVDATITVNIPDSETRAGGTNSALSVFENDILDADNVTMRYILMIYDAKDQASKDPKVTYSDGKTVNFDVRLVPDRDYTFVVWADVVKKNDADEWADWHYDTINDETNRIDLTNITVNESTWIAMDESRDAFTVSEEVTNFNGAKTIELKLKRPFAKLRVVTTDIKELDDLYITPTKATVSYTSNLYNSFNAFDGTVAGEMKPSQTEYAIAPYADNDFEGEEQSMVLFTDYIFAPKGEDGAVRFELTVYDQYGTDVVNKIKFNNFNTDIKTHRNYLTTISGNILTDGNKIKVDIQNAFENVDNDGNITNPDYDYETISSVAELLAAIDANSGEYIVTANLDVNEVTASTQAATRTTGTGTTINLNGYTITLKTNITIAEDKTLTITDINENGETGDIVNAGGKIVNDGTLNIEGGNFESNSTNDAPVIENNGTTNISGGVIGDNAVENTQNGDVNITGGTLEGDDFNDFINDDYTKNENNEIVKKPTIAKIGDAEYTSLIKAVAAVQDGDTIILEANEKFTEGNRTLNSGSWYDGLYYIGDKSFTIDLNGKTISHDDSVNDYLLNFKNVGSKANTITIKNGTLNAGTTAFCALCTASSNENQLTINLENVTIYNNRSNGSTAKIRGGAILNVKAGAKIIGLDSYLGIECVASTVNIYDGAEIYMNGTSSYNGCLAGACGGGTINVYGGYGKGVRGGFIAMTSGGTINVSGGEWIANTDGTVGDNSNLYVLTAQSNIKESGFVGGAYINVTGGTFRGGMDAWVLNNVEGEEAKLNISGGNFNVDPKRYLAEGCEANEANGIWTVRIIPVAKIGETEYETLEAAAAAAQAGNTIIVLRDITLAEELALPAGITFNGNGKQINGTIYAGGNLTFVGHTKVTSFSASYYDRVITIGAGACLEVTGGDRVTLAYGNTFNITGSVDNAKTADKAHIQPSLIIPAGISITGGNDATMNVTNAYVKIGSTTSKNSAANGEFTLNITNSIAEFTNQLTFSEPTNGNTPTFNVNITNSVLTTGTKLILAAPDCKMNVNNSTINVSTYFGNSGAVSLTNGSVLNGGTIQNSEGRNHCGSTVVNNSTFTITCGGSTGHAYDGLGTGSITAENGATVKVEYYKDMTINVDATSTFTGTEVQ